MRAPSAVVLATLLLSSACRKTATVSRDAGQPARVVRDAAAIAPDAPLPSELPSDAAGITITIEPPPSRSPGTALGRRCVLGGAPLSSDCSRGARGIAVDRKRILYLVEDREVRRYERVHDDDPTACRFEPQGAPIPLPPDNPRPQRIDGPLYMRSGGAAWKLVATDAAVYAHDFLGGMVRVDRGKAEPACLDVFGYDRVAAVGAKLLVSRGGIQRLVLGRKCTASSAKINDKERGTLHAAGGQLYAARNDELVRYDGNDPVEVATGVRICSITSVTACGDGVCVVDNNCMQLVQLAADGTVLRTLGDRTLFATRPYSLQGAVTDRDGTVYVLGRHRDKIADRETCETALYALPPALFER